MPEGKSLLDKTPVKGRSLLQSQGKSLLPASAGAKQTAPSEEPSFLKKAWSFTKNVAKEIPSGIARGFATGSNFLLRTTATGSEALSKKFNVFDALGIKVSPETKAFAQNIKTGLEKPLIIPGTETPIIETAPFTSGREAGGYFGEAAFDSITNILSFGTASAIKAAGKSILKNVAEQGLKTVAKEQAAKLLTKDGLKLAAKHMLTDFALGAGGAASYTAQDKNATTQDIFKSSLVGGAGGVAIPRVVGTGLGFGVKATKLASESIFGSSGRIASMIETKLGRDVVEQAEKNTSKFLFAPTEKTATTAVHRALENTASALRFVENIPTKLATYFESEFAPLRPLQKQIDNKGLDIENAFQMTKLVGRKTEADIRSFLGDGISKYGERVWNMAKHYSNLLDRTDRIANGTFIGETINGKVVTPQQVVKEMLQFRRSVTPEVFNAIKEAAAFMQTPLRKRLKEMKDVGIISSQEYARIIQSHPNYIPHRVLDFVDNANPFVDIKKSFGADGMKLDKAKGSTRSVELDTDAAVIARMMKDDYTIAKQKAVNRLFEGIKGAEERLGFKKIIDKKLVDRIRQLKQKSTITRRLFNDAASRLKTEKKFVGNVLSNVEKMLKKSNELEQTARVFASDFEASSKIEKLITRSENWFFKAQDFLSSIKSKQELISIKEVLLKDLNDIKKDISKELKDLHVRVPKQVDVPKGMEIITRLNNGVKETWLVPKDIGLVLKGYDETLLSGVNRWFSNHPLGRFLQLPAALRRATAVTKNPLFMFFRNPVRDIQTASMYTGFMGKELVSSLLDTIHAGRGKKSDLYKIAEDSGAFLGTILQKDRDPDAIIREVLGKNGILSKKIKGKSNKSWYASMRDGLEEMTRLAVFKKGLKSGMTPEEAAKLSRTATVDFSKSGRLVQLLNKFIPFLNPAVQGTINTARLIGKDPVQFSRRAFHLAAVPAAALFAYNGEYESYQNIPRSTRLRNWIIMLGEEDGRDFKNRPVKVPIYITIPKGEMQMALAGMVERALGLSKEKYPQETGDFLKMLADNANPIGNNSMMLPEGLKEWVELKTNYSFFRNGKIVPEWVKVDGKWRQTTDPAKPNYAPPETQSKESTTELAKMLGKALGWSPIKIDYVIKTGVVGDLIRLLDLPIRAEQSKELFNPDDKTSDLLDLSKLPLIQGLLRSNESGDFESRQDYEKKQGLEKARQEVQKRKETIQKIEERKKNTEGEPTSMLNPETGAGLGAVGVAGMAKRKTNIDILTRQMNDIEKELYPLERGLSLDLYEAEKKAKILKRTKVLRLMLDEASMSLKRALKSKATREAAEKMLSKGISKLF